jgi:hypothetical protein
VLCPTEVLHSWCKQLMRWAGHRAIELAEEGGTLDQLERGAISYHILKYMEICDQAGCNNVELQSVAA